MNEFQFYSHSEGRTISRIEMSENSYNWIGIIWIILTKDPKDAKNGADFDESPELQSLMLQKVVTLDQIFKGDCSERDEEWKMLF